MNAILYLIALPILCGVLCLIIPKLKEIISVIVSVITFIISFILFFDKGLIINNSYFLCDTLSRLMVVSISLFGFLVILYSLKLMSSTTAQYYCYILWTLGASYGVVLANNLVLLMIFWGFIGLTLFLLMQINKSSDVDTSTAAKKTFIIIGGSDCLMIFGIAILWLLTGTFDINKIHLSLPNLSMSQGYSLAVVAFICFAVAAFAKAGAMPFHTWIPDMAEVAPVTVTAFLPASLDKLLGIYLLVRICVNIFEPDFWLKTMVLLVGAITIIAAVFMAMMQHNVKKLLAYHAVSQVGYMILGIGTCNPIGIAGGLFHMLNHAIYKSCLFLSGGSVEHKTGTSDLNHLGGLAKYMPITFVTTLITALSISGIPPLNGFVSKWLVYQGIVDYQNENIVLWWIFLVVALFGSALTLASFIKLLHAIFLGQKPEYKKDIKEVDWTMWLPQLVLAGLCIIFGIFAFQIPLEYLIIPSVTNDSGTTVELSQGFGQPGLIMLLIIIGIAVGLIIYYVSKVKVRKSEAYIGTETLPYEARITGTEFYQTIQDISFLKKIYVLAENKMFDIYDWGKKIVFSLGKVLSDMHTGNLHTYLGWCLLGLLILLIGLVH